MAETSDTIEIKYQCIVTDHFGAASFLGLYHPVNLFINPMINGYQCPIEGYKINRNVSPHTMATRIDDKHIVLKQTFRYDDDVDVCVGKMKPGGPWPIELLTNEQSWKDFTKRHPPTPIILFQDEHESKMIEAKGKKCFTVAYDPEEKFICCLCNHKLNESKRNQLVRDYGAVKFVRYYGESGRGLKILLDEMVYDGRGKIMDERERRKNHCAVT